MFKNAYGIDEVQSNVTAFQGKGIKNEHNEIIDYVVVQDHSYGNRFDNEVGDQPSNFNVRPITNTQNGKVSGTKGHYYFKSKYTWD